MELIKLFLSSFCPAFAVMGFALTLVWFFKRSVVCFWRPPFVGRKSFSELSRWDKAEQKRLLEEAIRQAFRGWRWLLPITLEAAFFASGAAIGYTLPMVIVFPGSFWMTALIAIVFAAIGAWVVSRLAKIYVRRSLQKLIESTSPALAPCSPGR
jgi:pilus assembly protein TadC